MTDKEFISILNEACKHMTCTEIAGSLNKSLLPVFSADEVEQWDMGMLPTVGMDEIGMHINVNLTVFLAARVNAPSDSAVEADSLPPLRRSTGCWDYD